MVDPTYRWLVVAVFTAALTVALLLSAFRAGFDVRAVRYVSATGGLCILYAVVINRVMGEDFVEAIALQARFGMPFSDSGIQGYGWGLVFGYSFLLSAAIAYIFGAIGKRFGLLRSRESIREYPGRS